MQFWFWYILKSLIGIAGIIGINRLIKKLLIRRALSKKILPALKYHSLQFLRCENLNWFNKGDFEFNLEKVPPGGDKHSIYQRLYFKNVKEIEACVTVRIDNEFLIVTNAYFKPELKTFT